MTSELEDKLRAVLHERGAAITADRLRPAVSPGRTTTHEAAWTIDALPRAERRTRSNAARFAPVLAAAAVVGIIVGIVVTLALVAGGGSPPRQQAGGRSGALAGVLGRTWILRTVRAPDGTVSAIPTSIGASVTFLGTGDRLAFEDGVGAFRAAYTETADGNLDVHDVTGSPGNYSGSDHSQLAAIAGVDAIGVPIHNFAPPPIQVELVSGRLRITAQGYRLSLAAPVPVAPSASQLPSSTPVRTTTTSAHPSSASAHPSSTTAHPSSTSAHPSSTSAHPSSTAS